MANAPHTPEPAKPAPPAEDPKHAAEARAAEARKLFDENEKANDDRPVTTQTDQLRRSAEMELVGPANWMAEQDRRIRERQGDPPIEPRQVHGVAPAQKPH